MIAPRPFDPDAVARALAADLVRTAEARARDSGLEETHGAVGLLLEAYAAALAAATGPHATPAQRRAIHRISARMIAQRCSPPDILEEAQ